METSELDVAIVGGGFAGIGLAMRLQAEAPRLGLRDWLLFEQAPRVGGTWRENRYPGAACDVESQLYSFSFGPRFAWSRSYAGQAEILSYLESCVAETGIAPRLRLSCPVSAARWDESRRRWLLETPVGVYAARTLVSALGGLSRPYQPRLPGLERFQGTVFHTARWPEHASLAGQRVAVIGTGASAVQLVPALAGVASHVTLLQRTPSWIIPKGDRPLTSFEHRWPRLMRLRRYLENEWVALGMAHTPELMRRLQWYAEEHLERSVPAGPLREALRPPYALGCKRVLLSDEFYPALQRPDVSLVPAATAFDAAGVIDAAGRHHTVDAVVFATGFQPGRALVPMGLQGAGGTGLAESWKDGAQAYLGTTVHGFPNLFLMTGPNVGLGHNSMVYMMESQYAYILDALRWLAQSGRQRLEVRRESQQAFGDEMTRRHRHTIWQTGGCRSWYLDAAGRNATLWPGFTLEYRWRTRRFDPLAYDAR